MSMWDLVQHQRLRYISERQVLSDTSLEIATTQSRSRDEALEDRLDQVILLAEAMWELLSDRFGLTLDDLDAKVREVDARDGVHNGKRAPMAPSLRRRCTSCEAVVPPGAPTCQFCGAAAPLGGADPFDV